MLLFETCAGRSVGVARYIGATPSGRRGAALSGALRLSLLRRDSWVGGPRRGSLSPG